ncbi:alpha/beta hydrolase [Fulvivirga kasyanovii]|uniref:Alpha/beta fold hydrolase n=1 Tax=Fulvivirga kasyanovii TaxID=396812 RepID=A0ABW9RSD2_9BACT|nr:alpha/beta fold hydrolase [Fulvivirga kasyanovii]MTI26893.1 alpha/beta fold hydrolase [Fulvivirga kasyanovii]
MKRTFILFLIIFILPFICLGINPDREYILKPDAIGLDYKEMIINAGNATLKAWIIDPKTDTQKNTTIILAYPDAGNMSYFTYHASIFASHGYRVVTFDYRGFGESSDFEVERMNLYHDEFIEDLTSVVDKVSQTYKTDRIGIWGLSMGAVVAVQAYEQTKDHVDFMILEGLVTDIKVHASRLKQAKDVEINLPTDFQSYPQRLRTIDIPVIVFAGTEDTLTTTQDAIALSEEMKNMEVITYEGGHLRGFQAWEPQDFGQGYLARVTEFTQSF